MHQSVHAERRNQTNTAHYVFRLPLLLQLATFLRLNHSLSLTGACNRAGDTETDSSALAYSS